jgi:hypothetical protein
LRRIAQQLKARHKFVGGHCFRKSMAMELSCFENLRTADLKWTVNSAKRSKILIDSGSNPR